MIQVFGSLVGKEEIEEVSKAINAQWLGIGPQTKRFENLLSEKIGHELVAVDTCSNALLMALEILKLKKNKKVIVPAITWLSCANAVFRAGLKPVFADVDYDTINITSETIGEVLDKDVVAIMSVHYAGYPAIFDDFKLPVIADCAHAVDTYFLDKHIADYSTISVFSFDSMKNIACGELGGITSLNQDYIEQAKRLRYCGILKSGLQASTEKNRWWEYEVEAPFIKMLPNDVTASIGIAQFNKLSFLQQIRGNIYDYYTSRLMDLDWLRVPPEYRTQNLKHSYFTYYLRILNGRRDELARYLLKKGIYTTVRYQPLHLVANYKSKQILKNAEILNEQLINIPLHPNLSVSDIDYITESIIDFDKS